MIRTHSYDPFLESFGWILEFTLIQWYERFGAKTLNTFVDTPFENWDKFIWARTCNFYVSGLSWAKNFCFALWFANWKFASLKLWIEGDHLSIVIQTLVKNTITISLWSLSHTSRCIHGFHMLKCGSFHESTYHRNSGRVSIELTNFESFPRSFISDFLFICSLNRVILLLQSPVTMRSSTYTPTINVFPLCSLHIRHILARTFWTQFVEILHSRPSLALPLC